MPPPPRPLPLAAAPRRRPFRAWVVAALALDTAFGMVGCTPADETPAIESTATGAVATPDLTPTPSPTRSPKPERPAAMDDASIDGAVAFAKYFVSLYPYVYNTGDLTEWKEFSHPECTFCASVVSGVEEMHAQGQRNAGAEMDVKAAKALELSPGASYQIDLEVTQGPSTVLDEDDAIVASNSEAVNFSMQLILHLNSTEWSVRGVDAKTHDA